MDKGKNEPHPRLIPGFVCCKDRAANTARFTSECVPFTDLHKS